ncbi:GNAT family N-acetyltransferase [Arthrobacter sp. N1]|uniref:GNAT family N-acetyltransferase n=1 Tax=Arthrobacter sp. N1 TaxID=619291 RepID=UPI003BAE6B3B
MERLPQTLDHPTAQEKASTPSRELPLHTVEAPPATPGSAFPEDLATVTTRELRLLCNRTFQHLDTDHPALEAREQYDALIGELERRERQAAQRGSADSARETFRDNALFSRFELFRNGVMAGYVQYDMRGGHVLLLHSVIDPRFQRIGVESVLMQAVLLNAHRRRLAVMPYCPEAQDFLAAHPRFLSLIPARQRRRFTLLMASRAEAAPRDDA